MSENTLTAMLKTATIKISTFILRRYHFSGALFHKLVSKFNLGALYRATGSAAQKRISHVLRQYFGIPLLKPNHMKGEIERLERELRALSTHVAPTIAERLNRFHIYVVNYWMNFMGPVNISVAGALHKTNNVIER